VADAALKMNLRLIRAVEIGAVGLTAFLLGAAIGWW
jgi:hypothetical protein